MTSLTHFERLLSRSHSNYLAQLSIDNITQGNHANKVLSKITVLASVLVPLNLVCGMFGMNVAVPWRAVESTVPFYGILGALLLFVLIALTFARRRRYIWIFSAGIDETGDYPENTRQVRWHEQIYRLYFVVGYRFCCVAWLHSIFFLTSWLKL